VVLAHAIAGLSSPRSFAESESESPASPRTSRWQDSLLSSPRSFAESESESPVSPRTFRWQDILAQFVGGCDFPNVCTIYSSSYSWHPQGLVTDPLDGVAYFAGRAEVTRALQMDRLLVYAFELETNPHLHDILSDAGYAHALALLLRVRRGGIVWLFASFVDIPTLCSFTKSVRCGSQDP
jgi:hypothetical protein